MIGIGVVTCDRPEFFKQCYESIPKNLVDHIIVVNDGLAKIDGVYNEKTKIINHARPRQGVGFSKNQILEYLLQQDCEHLFIIEDDIIITNENVFQAYIDASKETGIKHFMFGYHGPANKKGGSGGAPNPKYKFKYDKTVIALNQHCVGAFCYYHRDCIQQCGLFDPRYYNAFEHIEHSYKLYINGFTTPYWNWADIADSHLHLNELACSEVSSSIRGTKDWSENIQKGYNIFKDTYGYAPFGVDSVPDISEKDIKQILKNIHEKHSYRD